MEHKNKWYKFGSYTWCYKQHSTVHCVVHSVYCTPHTALCTLYCLLHTHSVLHIAQRTVYSVLHTIPDAHRTVHSVLYSALSTKLWTELCKCAIVHSTALCNVYCNFHCLRWEFLHWLYNILEKLKLRCCNACILYIWQHFQLCIVVLSQSTSVQWNVCVSVCTVDVNSIVCSV